jgi:hypothetical protein
MSFVAELIAEADRVHTLRCAIDFADIDPGTLVATSQAGNLPATATFSSVTAIGDNGVTLLGNEAAALSANFGIVASTFIFVIVPTQNNTFALSDWPGSRPTNMFVNSLKPGISYTSSYDGNHYALNSTTDIALDEVSLVAYGFRIREYNGNHRIYHGAAGDSGVSMDEMILKRGRYSSLQNGFLFGDFYGLAAGFIVVEGILSEAEINYLLSFTNVTGNISLPTNLAGDRVQTGVALLTDRTIDGSLVIPANTSNLSYYSLAKQGTTLQFIAFDSDEGKSILTTPEVDPALGKPLEFTYILGAPSGGIAQNSKVSGIVQIDGTPAKRTVRAFGYDPTTHDLDGSTVNLSKSLGHSTSDPETGDYTIDLLAGYGQEIFVVAFDDYGAPFTPEATLAAGNRIHPTTPNGHVWETTGAGTLPADEPTWVVDTETSQLYGTASMIAWPFYRPMVHGPIMPEVTVPEGPALPTVIGEASNGGFYAGDITDGGNWYKLIVADIEADAYGLPWGDSGTDLSSAESGTNGPANTEAMRGSATHEAGNHCLDYRGGGFDDWYMPARDELAAIYQNLGLDKSPPADFQTSGQQAFDAGYYWCSTQYSSSRAWIRRFSDGFENYYGKDGVTGRRVRPVRRLEFTP